MHGQVLLTVLILLNHARPLESNVACIDQMSPIPRPWLKPLAHGVGISSWVCQSLLFVIGKGAVSGIIGSCAMFLHRSCRVLSRPVA